METLYVIRHKGFVGNCILFWGPNRRGYTTDLKQAGKYNGEEAEQICSIRPEQDRMYSIEEIDKHTVIHVDGQSLPWYK